MSQRIYVLLFFIFFNGAGFAQESLKKQRITLAVDGVTLDELVEVVRQKFGIHIVYSVSQVTTYQRLITLHISNRSLTYFLHVISQHYEVSYEFVSDYVVLKRQKETSTSTNKEPNKVPERAAVLPDTLTTPADPEMPVVIQETHDPQELTDVVIVFTDTLHREDEAIISQTVHRSIKRKRYHLISLHGLQNFEQVRFRSLADPNQRYDRGNSLGGSVTYSYGVDKLMFTAGCSYVSFVYRYHRNFRIVSPDDPIPIPDVTSLQLHYIEFPIYASYRMHEAKRISLYVDTGFHASLLKEQLETTRYLTQGEPNTTYFIGHTRHQLMAGVLGVNGFILIRRAVHFSVGTHIVQTMNRVNTEFMRDSSSVIRLRLGLTLRV